MNAIKEQLPAPAYDIMGGILAFEDGSLDREGTIELFQHLVDSGLAWQLQGHYGRSAQDLIDAGEVTRPAPKAHKAPEIGRLVKHDPALNIGPYTGVEYEATLEFKLARRPSRKFFVFTYKAYNACGLVGHECNGVAILDENRKQVLCDELAKQVSGWSGASEAQVDLVRRLQASGWNEFRQTINQSGRNRYSL